MSESGRFRKTRQRTAVLEALRSVKTHPSAEEVYLMVKEKIPRISLGTVYRNLEMLTEQGLIQKLDGSGSQRRFDGNPERHYHFRCLDCGKIIDAEMEPISDLEEYLVKRSDFEVTGHRLEFLGLCLECRERSF